MMVAVADAISKGMKEATVSSGSNTSKAKMTPAMGLLKTAEMPAAAPHAMKRLRKRGWARSSLATLEPIAEPVSTMGASRPAEPPKLTVSALDTMWE